MRANALSWLLLAALATGCGGGATVLATTPVPGAAAAAGDLPEPRGRWTFELPEVDWTPAMIGGEQGQMLGQALAGHGAVALVLERGLGGAELEDQLFQMIKAAAPETAVVARARGTLDRLLEERGEIPYRVTLEPAGTDVIGRPYYLPKEHPLQTEWLGRKSSLKGAEALLTVRRIEVGEVTLRQLREQRRGGCAELEAALERALAGGRESFAPYLEAVDGELSREFRRQLAEALPFWRAEIAAGAGEVAPQGEEARCYEASATLLDQYEPCREQDCALAPRIDPAAGGVIGIDREPLDRWPDRCPVGALRDYRKEIEELAARAVDAVLPALQGPWAGELVRYGALQRAAAGIREHCTARHRRISADGLAAGRDALRTFAGQLRDLETAAEWAGARGQERLAGVGPVAVLARTRSSGPDPGRDAAALLERLRGLDRCTAGGERLLQAALISVGSSEVEFMGIFFEEQLLCEGLPPGQP